jgi:hypothetical protein
VGKYSYTRAVPRQRLGKHVPAATDTHATIEILLEIGREPQFREELSMEEEE